MHSSVAVVVEKIENGFLVKISPGVAPLYAYGAETSLFCTDIASVAEYLPQAFAKIEEEMKKLPKRRRGAVGLGLQPTVVEGDDDDEVVFPG